MKTPSAVILLGILAGVIFFFQSTRQQPPVQQINLATKPRTVYVESTGVTPAPVTPRAHLAPEGTYFLRAYVSFATKTGVCGWVPGQMVRLVGENQPDPYVFAVTDGRYSARVLRDLLTRDLDEAAAILQVDQSQQDAIAANNAKLKSNFDGAQKDREFAQAKRVEAIGVRLAASSIIGRKWSALGDRTVARDQYAGIGDGANSHVYPGVR